MDIEAYINTQLQSEYGKLILIGIFFVVTFIAFFVWGRVYKVMTFLANKSSSQLSKIALFAVNIPFATFILFIGGYIILGIGLTFVNYDVVDVPIMFSFALTIVLFWTIFRFISKLEKELIAEGSNIFPQLVSSRIKISPLEAHSLIILLRVGVIIIAALTLLNVIGVSIAGLLAFGGLGGIILGFALKDPLSNFVAGALLFWERPFVVGDWVRCPALNVEGVVEKISWRTTLIRTFDKRPLYVPNAIFVNNHIENPQRMKNRRILETIGVRYEDITKLPALLKDVEEMLREDEGIDNNQTLVVAFDKYGDSSLNFFISAITYATSWADFQRVKGDILFKIADLVKKHGADFAYPTQLIKLDK